MDNPLCLGDKHSIRGTNIAVTHAAEESLAHTQISCFLFPRSPSGYVMAPAGLSEAFPKGDVELLPDSSPG